MALENSTPDEDEVAKLLLHLKVVIFTRELKSKVVFEWGRTATRTNPRIKVGDNACLPSQPTMAAAVRPESNSPATPLSLSSESESKVKSNQLHHRHHRKKKKLEETFTELTQQQLRLQIEIRNVSRYYQRLKNFNCLLRAKKNELISAPATVKPDSKKGESCYNQASSKDQPVLVRSGDGRLIELDLNVPADEDGDVEAYQPSDLKISDVDGDEEAYQPSDLKISELEEKERDRSRMKIRELEKERHRSKMKASEARLRRIQIKRYKKSYTAANNKNRKK